MDQDCNKGIDEYCDDDADGYNVWEDKNRPGGDCDELDPNINPGAYEVVGNKRDDNCDKQEDEDTASCDKGLFPVDAAQFAHSIEICKPWLLDAQWNRVADVKARAIASRFGNKILPQKSESMALFSTGMAYVDRQDRNYVLPRPGTRFQGQEPNPLPVVSNNACTNGPQQAVVTANDMTSLTVTIKAPTNAKAFLFKFNFFSAEYSDFVGAQYNDMFIVKMTSKKIDGTNIVFDTNNQPVTVNTGFFQVCQPQPICSMCVACGGNSNCATKVCGVKCVKGRTELEGTGYDEFIVGRHDQQVGGATGWLTTSAPVTPGETFTLQFFIFDGADHEYDSAVLIDGFQWCSTTPSPGPSPDDGRRPARDLTRKAVLDDAPPVRSHRARRGARLPGPRRRLRPRRHGAQPGQRLEQGRRRRCVPRSRRRQRR